MKDEEGLQEMIQNPSSFLSSRGLNILRKTRQKHLSWKQSLSVGDTDIDIVMYSECAVFVHAVHI